MKNNLKYFGTGVTVQLDKEITLGDVKKTVGAVFVIKSINDLGNWMQTTMDDKVHANIKHNRSMDVDYTGWRGSDTVEDWLQVIKRGDKNVMNEIIVEKKKASKEFATLVTNSSMYDTEGLYFDIGKVLSGEPECWVKPSKAELPDEITVRITTLASSSTNAKKIIKGAGRVLGMIDKLEKDGYKVKLENWLYTERATKSGAKNKIDLLTVMTVKDFNESINYAKMSAMVSPSLQRRGMFMLREVLLDKKLSPTYGMGGVFNYREITPIFDERAMDELQDILFENKKA